MALDMVRVNTRVSKEINDWLDARSEATGIPKSTMIYLALEEYKQSIEMTKEKENMKEIVRLLAEVKRSMKDGLID